MEEKKREKRERFPWQVKPMNNNWGHTAGREKGRKKPRRKHPQQILRRRVILSRVGASLFYL